MKRLLSLLLSLSILLSTTVSAAAASNYSDLISGVLDDMSANNSYCSGAPQQSANGAYRLVEMLSIIAMEHNSGHYGDLISGVLDDMSSNNSYCSGAPQQTANGAYGLWKCSPLSLMSWILPVRMPASFRAYWTICPPTTVPAPARLSNPPTAFTVAWKCSPSSLMNWISTANTTT